MSKLKPRTKSGAKLKYPAKKKRGGKRRGAGRKPTRRPATEIDPATVRLLALESPPSEIETTAQRHARVAIAAFVKKLLTSKNEAARVASANAILDRGYGKPAVDMGGEPILPFAPAPRRLSVSEEIRAEARRHAPLAIEVLRRITEFGQGEMAMVNAARSLLDRALGTVGIAKLPDELKVTALGKKERAQEEAEAASVGRYAIPAAPKTSLN